MCLLAMRNKTNYERQKSLFRFFRNIDLACSEKERDWDHWALWRPKRSLKTLTERVEERNQQGWGSGDQHLSSFFLDQILSTRISLIARWWTFAFIAPKYKTTKDDQLMLRKRFSTSSTVDLDLQQNSLSSPYSSINIPRSTASSPILHNTFSQLLLLHATIMLCDMIHVFIWLTMKFLSQNWQRSRWSSISIKEQQAPSLYIFANSFSCLPEPFLSSDCRLDDDDNKKAYERWIPSISMKVWVFCCWERSGILSIYHHAAYQILLRIYLRSWCQWSTPATKSCKSRTITRSHK